MANAGKPSRRNTSASKPATRALKKTGEVSRQFDSVKSWDRKSAGGWVAGQSMTINPGDPKAISRLRHSKKFKARGKKVIRPRVRKQRHPDTDVDK